MRGAFCEEHSAIMRIWQGEEINRRQGILAGVSTFCTELNCDNCRVHSACQTNQRVQQPNLRVHPAYVPNA